MLKIKRARGDLQLVPQTSTVKISVGAKMAREIYDIRRINARDKRNGDIAEVARTDLFNEQTRIDKKQLDARMKKMLKKRKK